MQKNLKTVSEYYQADGTQTLQTTSRRRHGIYTTGADTGEKRIQNLSGLEDNVIYAEQKVTGKDGTASAYQDFLYEDVRALPAS